MRIMKTRCQKAAAPLGSPAMLAAILVAGLYSSPVAFGDGDLCGLECLGVAAEAARACREEGGGFFECASVFADALAACREEAGCETPELPDREPLCGEECIVAARDGVRACRESDEDFGECLSAVREELIACLEAAGCELPEHPDAPPEHPDAPCGAGCFREALVAGRDCLRDGNGLRECAGVFRETLEACREASGCGEEEDADPADPADPAGDAGDTDVLGLLLEEPFVRGDTNRDGKLDVSDPVASLNFLFGGGVTPVCLDAADANDDGAINVSDPIMTLGALFRGGSLPLPYPGAGYDPSEDTYTCIEPIQ